MPTWVYAAGRSPPCPRPPALLTLGCHPLLASVTSAGHHHFVLAQGYGEGQALTEGLLGLEGDGTAQNRKQPKTEYQIPES